MDLLVVDVLPWHVVIIQVTFVTVRTRHLSHHERSVRVGGAHGAGHFGLKPRLSDKWLISCLLALDSALEPWHSYLFFFTIERLPEIFMIRLIENLIESSSLLHFPAFWQDLVSSELFQPVEANFKS